MHALPWDFLLPNKVTHVLASGLPTLCLESSQTMQVLSHICVGIIHCRNLKTPLVLRCVWTVFVEGHPSHSMHVQVRDMGVNVLSSNMYVLGIQLTSSGHRSSFFIQRVTCPSHCVTCGLFMSVQF